MSSCASSESAVQASRERALGTSEALELKRSLKKLVIRSNTLVSSAVVGPGTKISSINASAEIRQGAPADGDILFLSSIAKQIIDLVGV
jgi:hypothetical protein